MKSMYHITKKWGYDEELAKSSAQAKLDGDDATVFANEKTFKDNFEQSLKQQLLKQPPLSTGMPPQGNNEDDQLRKWAGLK